MKVEKIYFLKLSKIKWIKKIFKLKFYNLEENKKDENNIKTYVY